MDNGPKHPICPWLAANAAGQITRGQVGPDGPTATTQGKSVQKDAPCVWGACAVPPPMAHERVDFSNVGSMDRP